MGKHYQVMFTGTPTLPKGAAERVFYGIALDPLFDAEARLAASEGLLVVMDAVTPHKNRIPEEAVTDLPVGDDAELVAYRESAYESALIESRACLGRCVPGAMFRVGVNDGYAYYVVTALRGSLCLVESRNFTGTRYMTTELGWGGWVAIRDISSYVGREAGLARLV